MSETTANEVELEETCWCTITILVSIIIAAFSYRFFGPENPEASKKPAPEPSREVYVQVRTVISRLPWRENVKLIDIFRKSSGKSQNRLKPNHS